MKRRGRQSQLSAEFLSALALKFPSIEEIPREKAGRDAEDTVKVL